MRRRFPLVRRGLLLLGDTLLVLLGLVLAYLANDLLKVQPQPAFNSFFTLIPIMLLVSWILLTVNGLLSVIRMVSSQVIISVLVTIVQLTIITFAASFLLGEVHSRSLLLLAGVFQFVLLSIWKFYFWRFEKARLKPKRVLVIGHDEDCDRIVRHFDGQLFSHFNVRQCLLATARDCNWREMARKVDLLIITAEVPLPMKAEIMRFSLEHGIQAALIPDFYELFCFNVELDKYDDIPVFRTKYLRPTMETRLMKRGLDIIVSSVSLLLLWPVFILVGLAIKLDSEGAMFYSQIRTGECGKEFRIYKFRTMRNNAEKLTGPVLATENDPRITRVGRFIRATRLDELPQLVNVFMGNMSIVGPRPERPVFVNEYNETIPNYRYRHNVKPGITGFAQVFGKYNTVPQDKLIYDLLYVQKCSVFTDLMVMLQTIRILLIKDSTAGVEKSCSKLNEPLEHNT